MLPGQTIQVKQGATNSDLQRVIENAIPEATKQLKTIAKLYKAKTEQESCKKIYNYLKNEINYKADGNNQEVKLPSALMRTGQGDCKSYTVFTSAILNNLKIPHSLAYVSFNPNDPTPTHIYVITENNCIIDAVYNKFNAEKKPSYKKLKKMNISIISGIKSTKKIGKHNFIAGLDFIGASQSGKDWAQSNGLMPYKSELWLVTNNTLFRSYALQKVFPLALSGRLITLKLIEKNSGGLANSLYKLRQASKTAQPTDPAYTKMRGIEIDWLKKGGNPYELYESIDEGNKKTPTGAYFNKLMRMKAGGYNPNPAQWIAAGVSALFGKKYNETTGKITGSNMGIGQDPVSTTLVIGSAPWWAVTIGGFVTTLGLGYLATKTPPATNEDYPGGPDTDNSGGGGGNDDKKTSLLPILLVGGAAAAYFIFKKK
jgi:hypothetical protein